jgi:hypothetical protein
MRSQRLIVPPPAGHASCKVVRLSLFLERVSGSIVSKAIIKSFKNALCAYFSQIGIREVRKLVSQIGLYEVHKSVSQIGLYEDHKLVFRIGLHGIQTLVSKRSLSSRLCAPLERGLGTVP